jgi:hypothetical protein
VRESDKQDWKNYKTEKKLELRTQRKKQKR